MSKKQLKDIKHGMKVMDVLCNEGGLFHKDIEHRTGLDTKTLQTVLNNLKKNGFITKNVNGQWEPDFDDGL